MKIGLVIQGPIIGYGQGPNININGFNATGNIYENIKSFSNLVECIVISTWENSGLNINNKSGKVVLIENKNLIIKEKDSRIRQFITSYEGAKFMKKNFNVTHLLKIRSDQLINSKLIINWLYKYFENSDRLNSEKIIFSDSLIKTPFYLGDFIFAGKIDNILEFLSLNLINKKLHDTVGLDYVLKFLSKKDHDFYSFFLKKVPLKYQIHKNINAEIYWNKVFIKYFEVIPIEVFETIVWRNKKIRDVLPNFEHNFSFYKEKKNDNIENYIGKIKFIGIIKNYLYDLAKMTNIKIYIVYNSYKKMIFNKQYYK